MISQDEYQIPEGKQAFLISLICPILDSHTNVEEAHSSMEELEDLSRTLGIPVAGTHIQNRKTPDPATLLGKGKLQEIATEAKNQGVELLIFDFELTASQVRNIKKLTKLDIIDRCNVILEIFAKHARTHDSKIQIEISRLEYMLPRLTSMWAHFSRQKGGVGMRGGEGEQQLELDRRIIRDRIAGLKKQLKTLQVSRKEQRKKRQNKAITTALVGYTNAGKSSLMNRLCKVEVKAEDKLFATLDSTYRMLNPDTKPPMILIDTVGFLKNLPNTLINGFKTTLESAIEADLLLIVCDLSSNDYQKHLEVTFEVLKELGLEDKERFIIFNKMDKVEPSHKVMLAQNRYPNSYAVSTLNPADMENLRQEIMDYFLSQQEVIDLFLPFEDGEAHSKVVQNTNIIKSGHSEKGTFYRIKAPESLFQALNLSHYVLGPSEERPFNND